MNDRKMKYQRMINKISIVAAVLSIQLTASQIIYAQTEPKPQLFEGMIGSAPVVMELTTSTDNTVTGRYFYTKHILDIALDGMKLADGHIQLGENQNYGDDKRFDMDLYPNHDGYRGEWHGHDVKHPKNIAISLTPIQKKARQNVYQLSSDSTDYDQIRLAKLSLRQQNITHFGNYDLQWWLEPISKVSFFRVISGYPADTLTRINKALTTRQWQEVNSYFSCQLGGARNSGGDYDVTVTPRFINDKVLSSSVESSYYCGGAHPDFSDNPINIDVKTGQELQLEDVLWVGKTKRITLKRDANGQLTDFDYATHILGPWINQTMTKLYPNEVGSDSKKDEDCDYRDPELWQFPAFYFTPTGLHLSAYFARVARACDDPDWAIVPWKIVNQHPGVLRMPLP